MGTEVTGTPATVSAIYTDGACSGNPGPGGWGTRIEFANGQVQELGGRERDTTNNRMEMQAAIAALEFLASSERISEMTDGAIALHTDSEYLKNGITKWISGWKRKGWKTSSGKAVLNQDLWQQLDSLSQTLRQRKVILDWRYVRGHAGDPGNERCDQIARAFAQSQPIALKRDALGPAAPVKSTAVVASEGTVHPSAEVTGRSATLNGKGSPVKLVTAVTSPAPDDSHNNHRDPSLNNPSINREATEESFLEPALESYERDPNEGNEEMAPSDSKSGSPNEVSRIERLRNALETLQVTDELAKQGYLITSSELADLMDVNASAVTSRGDYWAWRNWTVSRIRREGNQILWQLERVDE